MGLKYCPECGRLYAENPVGVCLDCQAAEEPLAQLVAEYLRNVRKATIDEVHEATGVKHKTILRMLKAGRIQTEHDFTMFFNCEKCGAPIPEGNYCEACSKKMTHELQEKLREMQEAAKPEPRVDQQSKTPGRMYTRDDWK